MVQRRRREAQGDALEVQQARPDQFRAHFHQAEDRLRQPPQHRPRQRSDQQRQPQRLAHQRPGAGLVAGAVALGDLGRGGEQGAGHQQEHRDPDRVAQRHRCQVVRTGAPGHHRIDEAHGGGRQLRDHDRRGEGQQFLEFGADAQATGKGQGGAVHGSPCLGRGTA